MRPLYVGWREADQAGPGTYDLCVTKVHNIEHRGSFAQHDLEKPLSDKEGTYSLAGHEADGAVDYSLCDARRGEEESELRA